MAVDEVLAARVREAIRGEPGVSEKRMFGGLCFLVHGNLSCGVDADLFVRTGPEVGEKLIARKHARAFAPSGRPMKGWVQVDPAAVSASAPSSPGCDLPSPLRARFPKKPRCPSSLEESDEALRRRSPPAPLIDRSGLTFLAARGPSGVSYSRYRAKTPKWSEANTPAEDSLPTTSQLSIWRSASRADQM